SETLAQNKTAVREAEDVVEKRNAECGMRIAEC
ncbi:MAG: hypothetical protein QOH31_849, partial [Verrucomicrobiota bacterium]